MVFGAEHRSLSTTATGAVYTAPAVVSAAQTVNIRAFITLSTSASASISLSPAPTVSAMPTSAILFGGQTQQFTATVNGSTNQNVTWSVSPAVGSINSSGLYSAPSTIAAQQTVTVTVISAANPNSSVNIPVTLSPGLPTPIGDCVTNAPSPGCVHFLMRTDSTFSPYILNITLAQEAWLLNHFWELQTYYPSGDQVLSWYHTALAYVELYGVSPSDPLVSAHPEWMLKDVNGSPLYINYDCSGGTCPLYAFDFSNPAFIQYRISQQIVPSLNAGFLGIWLDDVDMQIDTTDGSGNAVAPVNSSTGLAMTQTAWEQYMVNGVTQIRQAVPTAQILHNVIWYAGTQPPGSDPLVQQEIKAANIINLERGVSDANLVAGSGTYSMTSFLNFVDVVHSLGGTVDIQELGFNGDFGLAGYYLISTGLDALSNDAITPNNWWSGYDYNIGTPYGPRYVWNGTFRRDFTNGIVYLNPVGSPTTTVFLPAGIFEDTSGLVATSVTLAGGQAAVFIGSYTPPPAPVSLQVSLTSSYNREGIVTDTTFFAMGGADNDGNAYSANLLGSSLTFNGSTFTLGQSNALNIVRSSGTVITLPAGNYSTLNMLAAAVNESQQNQTITVTYTDSSTSVFTQSFSNWVPTGNQVGETTVKTMAHRDVWNGSTNATTVAVYGYSFGLNPSKTVSTITLPNDPNVVVLGLALLE